MRVCWVNGQIYDLFLLRALNGVRPYHRKWRVLRGKVDLARSDEGKGSDSWKSSSELFADLGRRWRGGGGK